MGDVDRLPVQHRQKPHCEDCKRDLPPVQGMSLSSGPDDWKNAKLEAVTFHVRCVCGKAIWLRVAMVAT